MVSSERKSSTCPCLIMTPPKRITSHDVRLKTTGVNQGRLWKKIRFNFELKKFKI